MKQQPSPPPSPRPPSASGTAKSHASIVLVILVVSVVVAVLLLSWTLAMLAVRAVPASLLTVTSQYTVDGSTPHHVFRGGSTTPHQWGLLTWAAVRAWFSRSHPNDDDRKNNINKDDEDTNLQSRVFARTLACVEDSPFVANAPHPLPTKPLPIPELERHYRDVLRATTRLRTNITMHSYAGYSGPWIENHWIQSFCCDRPLRDFGYVVPLFVQWVDLWVESATRTSLQTLGVLKGDAVDRATRATRRRLGNAVYAKRIRTELLPLLRPDVLYVTVSHYDGGIYTLGGELPPTLMTNILVLSGGGFGHVPIPLLTRELPLTPPTPSPELERGVSFTGKMRPPDDARTKVVSGLRACGVPVDVYYGPAWRAVMRSTLVNLTPRGNGRTSFHLFESLQLGHVPVHVWDDVCLLYTSDAADD